MLLALVLQVFVHLHVLSPDRLSISRLYIVGLPLCTFIDFLSSHSRKLGREVVAELDLSGVVKLPGCEETTV